MERLLGVGTAALAYCLAASAFGQGSIYVNGSIGNDAWDGRCEVWDGGSCGPKATIQAGIDAAGDGGEVLIADGVYRGPGNRDLDFRGKPITVRSAGGDAARCIIDCEQQGRGFSFQSDETADSIVAGLTIRNGFSDMGGGVYCFESSPTLSNCAIIDNMADCGGGVFCFNSGLVLINCQIAGNTGSQDGGGIHCDWDPADANPLLTNCSITGNVTGGVGGALYCSGSSPHLTNCTITGNSAGNYDAAGGGVFCGFTDAPVLTNCILWADLPDEIDALWGGWGDGPRLTYCDVQGGWAGEGNMDVDPDFAFPNDGHLLPGSPCIDAGTNEPGGGLPVQDIDGQPRLIDGDSDGEALVDMGAYEFNPAAPVIALSNQELTFLVGQGQSASQTVSVSNAGLGTLAWELQWQAEWLSAAPVAGESEGEADAITVQVDAGALARGRYDAVLWVVDPQASNSPRAIFVTLCADGVLHVPEEYPTIQGALDAASPGDEVIIADGLYTGPGNKELDFRGKAITMHSAGGDPLACIIDCEREGCGLNFHCCETADSVLRGMTVRNGNNHEGGGVSCSYSSPTLANCVLTCNTGGFGGALCCGCGSPTLIDCTLTRNTAIEWSGGGVFCSSSSPTLINCTISDNAANGNGGGFYCEGLSPTLINCVIAGNTASRNGGGLCFGGCATPLPRVTNCTITSNTAGGHGGGVFCGTPGPILTNCILWANLPEQVYFEIGDGPTLTYCDVQGGWAGVGNIEVDPNFAFPRDGHLLPGSACIDVGTADPPGGLPAEDIDGQARSIDGDGDGQDGPDMGAYELNPTASAIALSAADLTLFVWQGQTASQALSIRNSSLGTLAWQLDGQPDWLSAAPAAGESSGEVDAVTLTIDTQMLTHGRYDAVLWISDPQASNSPRALPIVLYVNAVLNVPDEYATIQAAIDATVPGDEVVLADGDYSGPGNHDLDFKGKSITVRSASREPAACIIDCQHQGRGFYLHTGETPAALIQGITICNGYEYDGAGVHCHGCNPTLSNCWIIGNQAILYGGGILSDYDITLIDCVIRNNTAGDYGGGLYGGGFRTTLTNCVISGNKSGDYGGGVCCYYNPTLTNCTIFGNMSENYGGGLCCKDSSSPVLTNCILWADAPEEVYVEEGSPTVTFCDVQGGWLGTGNIAIDPRFALAEDFHLLPGSPCLDAGTNDPAGGLPTEDFEGVPRPIDADGDGQALADMGVYEFDPAAPAIALSATELTFFVPAGQSASQTVSIRNSGLGTLLWGLVCEAEWLGGDPAGGQSSGEADVVTLSADARDLAPGRYATVLWVTDPRASNSPRAVSVVLHVTRVLHVPADYATIQAAIDVAGPGDEVLLADGVYTGAGNRDLDFCGKPITVRSASRDPSTCIIDCEQDGRGFLFQSGEDATSVLEAVTIRNGNDIIGSGVCCLSGSPLLKHCIITQCAGRSGGGVLCDSSSATLLNCVISDNTCYEGGGAGLYCYGAAPVLINCTISGNALCDGWGGAGLYCEASNAMLIDCTVTGNTDTGGVCGGGGICCCWQASPNFTNCTIAENSSDTSGGGLSCSYESNPTLTNCTICGNRSNGTGVGGGLYCRESDPTLINCLLSGNAARSGGAVYDTSSSPSLANCTITDNTASNGGGLYCMDSSCLVLTNCILWADAPQEIYVEWGSPTVTFCEVQGGWAGTGNIDSDPLFVDADGPDGDPATWEDNDYRLTAASPCIDAGDPGFVPPPGEVDPDGHTRLWDGDGDGLARVDMGAYEFGAYTRGDLNCDGLIDTFDIDPFILALTSAPDFAAYQAAYPGCAGLLADLNADGLVNAFDIDPFVRLLTGS